MCNGRRDYRIRHLSDLAREPVRNHCGDFHEFVCSYCEVTMAIFKNLHTQFLCVFSKYVNKIQVNMYIKYRSHNISSKCKITAV